jgi:hypothetical protein
VSAVNQVLDLRIEEQQVDDVMGDPPAPTRGRGPGRLYGFKRYLSSSQYIPLRRYERHHYGRLRCCPVLSVTP